MPPFKGFRDQHGHYSDIQQVAETGRWPRLNERMSKDVDDYLGRSPPGPEFRSRGSGAIMTSSRHSQGVIAAARDAIQSAAGGAAGVDAGADRELGRPQHPPLDYYVLGAGLSRHHVAELCRRAVCAARLLRPLIAWIGLCVTAVAALRGKIPQRAALPLMFAVCRMAADLSDVVSLDGAARVTTASSRCSRHSRRFSPGASASMARCATSCCSASCSDWRCSPRRRFFP